MEDDVVLTARMVVPAGMPVPVMLWPATRPLRVLMPVTEADPLVRTPVKTFEGVKGVPLGPNHGGAEPAGVCTVTWSWPVVALRSKTAGSEAVPPL